jgi:leucyl-tRNA synthetase
VSAEPPVYDPAALQTAAQTFWRDTRAFEVAERSDKPKYFCLSMLPYPSGALHMGHVRNYTIGDVISRFRRMTGHNVLQPMGWDAFGLPAENAAIKNKTAPAKWTYANIDHMRGQLQALGYAIDWSREFATCRPDYYVHEQRMFTRLMKKGLVYRKNSVVNWDPVDQTVLANEQVIDGRGWRSGAVVEKREIPQWFLKITAYAQELLDGLDALPGWPDSVKTMQRNWIGRSEGLEFAFDVADSGEKLRVYTTRPDTLMGVTFVSIAAEHPLAARAAERNPELAAFIADLRKGGVSEAELETQEKRGMATGLFAVHPISGEQVPIWVANFVLMGYGTGAVMAVPGHDERDLEFATKYSLPVKQVIALRTPLPPHLAPDLAFDPSVWKEWYGDKTNPAAMCVNSGEGLDGKNYEQAFEYLAAKFEREGRGERRVNFRIRDWGVSRQRYWGCPIPVIYCAKCDAVPVPEDQLPVVLPENVEDAFAAGVVLSPIKADPNWRKTICPQCGGPAERETDTFDTFMESSWYYARYTSPGAGDMVDERAKYWTPVDQYIGGIEHAILHLLYFRFYHKLLRDEGLVNSDEPAINLLCQGMVIAETFYRENANGLKEWFNPADVDVIRDEKGRIVGATLRDDGQPVQIGGVEKMAKSKNNGVDPQAMVDKYGADTVRLFSMFAAPPEQSLEWNEAGVEGCYRFLRRLWRFFDETRSCFDPGSHQDLVWEKEAADRETIEVRCEIHQLLTQAIYDYGRNQFNTIVSTAMKMLNVLERLGPSDVTNAKSLANAEIDPVHVNAQRSFVRREAQEILVLMLNPVTPHISHHLWTVLGNAETLLEDVPFPQADPAALARDTVTLAVQVNGKLRGTIEVGVQTPREDIEAAALAEANVVKFMDGMTVKKVIVVPGKIVNIVAA